MTDAGGHFIWNVRPEVFSFSPLPRWYGLLFVTGFGLGYLLMRHIFLRDGKRLDDMDRGLMYMVVGTVVGMRLGHCLFYEPQVYLREPWRILFFWEGGYASHGGFLGVIIALILFSMRTKDLPPLWLMDRVAIVTVFTAGCIRVGNFFNSEILGHPSEVPWAIVFQRVDNVPRHPGQLYEAFGYFVITAAGWLLYRYTAIAQTKGKEGRLLGLIIGVGFVWRFVVEFFKEDQVAFEAGMPLNMGQLLSIPFIIGGFALAAGVLQKQFKKAS